MYFNKKLSIFKLVKSSNQMNKLNLVLNEVFFNKNLSWQILILYTLVILVTVQSA